ncbi:MAG: helix-turn-helix transcriptional regulator [Planctomycetes bacterium]|nr:helix-turn-helix transcriptional regulator [Planctomycetota bacterium]
MGHTAYKCHALHKTQPPGYSFSTNAYEQFQLICVLAGVLKFENGLVRKDLRPGDLVVLRQGGQFRLSCGQVGYEGVGFVAAGELPPQWLGSAEALRCNEELRVLASLIERHIRAPMPESAENLQGLGRAMAWEASRLLDELHASAPSPEHWAAAARTSLLAELHSSLPTRKALEFLPMSYRQACRLFRRHFGLSPKEFQMQARIDHAKHLLTQTAMSVTDVSLELGFSSSQHFATSFRSATGCSPLEWRAAGRSVIT